MLIGVTPIKQVHTEEDEIFSRTIDQDFLSETQVLDNLASEEQQIYQKIAQHFDEVEVRSLKSEKGKEIELRNTQAK